MLELRLLAAKMPIPAPVATTTTAPPTIQGRLLDSVVSIEAGLATVVEVLDGLLVVSSVGSGEVVLTASENCTAGSVSGATLSWGVKDSFVSYISGPITKGAISTSGVTQSGSGFTWNGGSGAFNADLKQGEVKYTGSFISPVRMGRLI